MKNGDKWSLIVHFPAAIHGALLYFTFENNGLTHNNINNMINC